MIQFGDIRRLNLRTIWAKEASDFTPWLAENVQALGKSLGIELEMVGTEEGVGDFSLDLLARDLGTGRPVVIENQLTATDHDHLGKLLTYAAGFDAFIVIWVSGEIREEHRQVLDWLNQRTDRDTAFFGVVVEVLTIDDSRPAYNFKPIVFPNQWKKDRPPQSISGRGEAYRVYFQELIDELREKHKFTGARLGQPQNWYSFSSGFPGISYGASFAQGNRVRIELYIDQGDRDKNKSLFDELFKNKERIEEEYGLGLEWERLNDRRASRIAIYRAGSVETNSAELAEIRSWSIEQLLKFKEVLGSWVRKYSNH